MQHIERPQQPSRRTALKAFGAAAALPWLSERGLLAFARIQEARAAPQPRILTAPQFRTVEALVEMIIPADDRSPGAKDARVADYIDLLVSELEPDDALRWVGGLAALEAESSARFGAAFVDLAAAQADAILRDISRNERAPQTPLETFFVMAKQATVRGYYTSEIGIHQELRYQGNKFLRDFVGCETENGKDCPHCGQKARA
ncbi:MAG TPA: gluconate 2-dehydrogenase subunit 3 family protein [Vicinamibacterales bacterium]|nr:gluconate 2-dehydrogenase subunit 3 family protein [Vicinamibacterales bacterium]